VKRQRDRPWRAGSCRVTAKSCPAGRGPRASPVGAEALGGGIEFCADAEHQERGNCDVSSATVRRLGWQQRRRHTESPREWAIRVGVRDARHLGSTWQPVSAFGSRSRLTACRSAQRVVSTSGERRLAEHSRHVLAGAVALLRILAHAPLGLGR